MKLKFFIIVLITSSILSILSCNNSSKPTINKNPKIEKHVNVIPKIIAHRGTGSEIKIINEDTIFENTLAAVKYGFDNFDGVESDIQMSKSGTIWLFHNDDLYCFDTLSPKCIPSSTDKEIIELNTKLPYWRQLCTLEDVYKYQTTVDNKYLSLDVKGYFKTTCIKNRNISDEYMHNIAKEIIRLAKKYNLENNTLVETDYKEVLNTIKNETSTIECYLLGYSNFTDKLNYAIEKRYDGLSFNMNDTSLNIKNIELLHNHKLKIQIWTVNIAKKKNHAIGLQPDFIQSDVVF